MPLPVLTEMLVGLLLSALCRQPQLLCLYRVNNKRSHPIQMTSVSPKYVLTFGFWSFCPLLHDVPWAWGTVCDTGTPFGYFLHLVQKRELLKCVP